MKETFKGKVSLWGKEYAVKVVNGDRLTQVDGKWLTTEQFIETVSLDELDALAFVGRIALRDERTGVTPQKGKYQYIAEKLSDPVKRSN